MSLKRGLKYIILRLAIGRKLLSLFARRHCPIFVYHRFGSGTDGRALSAQVFDLHLEEMQRAFNVLSLSEFVRQRQQGRVDWRSSCVITVDDGYRDFYEIAYPALRRRGLPATLFVTTGFMHKDTWLWWDLLSYLFNNTSVPLLKIECAGEMLALDFTSEDSRRASWARAATLCTRIRTHEKKAFIQALVDSLNVCIPSLPTEEYHACTIVELDSMAENGMTFGPHSVSHPILTHCDLQEWKTEIIESRRCLSALTKGYVDIFAFPGGTKQDYSTPIVEFLESSGFEGAVVAHYDDFRQEGRFSLRRCSGADDLVDFRWKLYGGEYLCDKISEWMCRVRDASEQFLPSLVNSRPCAK